MSENKDIKTALPKLRFPEFKNDKEWDIMPIQKACEILNNKRKAITSTNRKSGIYPYYGASGICDYIDNYIFSQPLLLVGEDGAKWGAYDDSAFIATGKYWVNNHAHVLNPIKINIVVLKNYLVMLDMSSYITGAAPPKLTLGKLKDIPVPIANSCLEQTKIAECLSSLDDAINAVSEKIEALKEYKKGLLQQLFPAEGKTTPAFRFPEFQNSGEWKDYEVGDIFDVKRGYVLPMGLLKNSCNEEYSFPVYSSQTKNNGLAGYYNEYLYENAITWTTDGANAGDVNFRQGKFYCTNVCGVLLNAKGFANKCVAEILNSVSKKHVSYVGNPKLMNGVMSKIRIYLPKIDEQRRISDFLTSIDNIINLSICQTEQLKEHKKGLMQQLFPTLNE